MFRKKPTYVPPTPDLPLLGLVLLNAELTSTTGLTALIEGTLGWSIETDSTEKDPILQIQTPDGTAFISVLNRPIPDGEAEANAARNYFWENGVEQVSRHRAHLLVTVLGEQDKPGSRDRCLAQSRVFVDVIAAILGMDSAVGVYIGAHELVHEAGPFREIALESREDGTLPAPLLVHVMAAPQPDGNATGYTRGLRTYGHDDLEILDSRHTPQEVYELLMHVAIYIITTDTYLMPGETLGYTDEMRLPITLSAEATHFDGRALRIGF